MHIPLEIYKDLVYYLPIPTVDIIFLYKNKILLGKRKSEPLKWEYHIPWGRIYKNELLKDAVVRKGLEETNIKIDREKLQFIGCYDVFDNSIYDWISEHCITHIYLYNLEDADIKNIETDPQHDNLCFFGKEEIESKFLVDRLKVINSHHRIF